MIGAHEWRTKGLEVPGLPKRIHPHYGVFTPTRGEYEFDGVKQRSAGDAKRYARFVVTELKPFIDARYLTLPGPRTTSLVGSSMGGLVSLYTDDACASAPAATEVVNSEQLALIEPVMAALQAGRPARTAVPPNSDRSIANSPSLPPA